MKTNLTRWMIAAAALAVAAGSASAQTYNAEVPLSFHVGGKLMTPGDYQMRISDSGAIKAVIVYNRDTRSSAILLAAGRADVAEAMRKRGHAAITFECSGGNCALSRLWDGDNAFAYTFPALKTKAGEPRAEVVTLTLTRAD